MSLRAYFLHHRDEFELHYNCSAYSVESIPLAERAHPVAGFLLMAIGVVSLLAYVLCICALLQPKLRRLHVYNQMLYYGVF